MRNIIAYLYVLGLMRSLFIIIGFLLSAYLASATHNRAGEITFVQTGPLSFEFTITTYTDPTVTADRNELTLNFSDGDSLLCPRINGPLDSDGNHLGVVVIAGFAKVNIYKGSHTFPGPGKYKVWMLDPNRTAGSNNIPNSVNQPFYLETSLRISSSISTGGLNSSPVLLNMPLDQACVCKRFIHNPNAVDPDPQDILKYKLVNCKGTNGFDIGGYTIPTGTNVVTLDENTGDLLWNCPGPLTGEYNFALLVISYRNGVPIDTVRRDMQVIVQAACNNDPPVITAADTCVNAGDLLVKSVSADDINGHDVSLSSTGLVYSISNSPANFPQPLVGPVPISADFTWQTNCGHVRLNPYQVSFKAEDFPPDPNDHLADIRTIRIRVVSPGPDNLQAAPQGNTINLTWQQCPCTGALGYKIYRRTGPSGFVPDNCQTGIPSSTGYQLVHTANGVGTLNWTDNNNGSGLVQGQEYCYMIYAFFQDGSESYASNEACSQLVKDIPVITNVSVNITGNPNGEFYIAWSPPDLTLLDTNAFPPPYRYMVNRSPGSTGNALSLVDSTASLVDTTFIHQNANTVTTSSSYRIDLFSYGNGRVKVGSTGVASSVFLSTLPSDNQITINWLTNVPWTEDTFVVYRLNDAGTSFDSIGYSTIAQYVDVNLVNGRSYCYKVKSIGRYALSGYVNPIINFSQEICDTPLDNVPPCPPLTTIEPSCDSILNTLEWTVDSSCADDATNFLIYYTPTLGGTFTQVGFVDNSAAVFYHNNNAISIAGCYYVLASDSVGNISTALDTICVNNCPVYSLPNVFSPNGDGSNDTFRPFDYKFVESVNFVIFNRWGTEVFKTGDPDIGWDGIHMDTGQPCSDGVYYYVCEINEITLEGTGKRIINGFVHLITGTKTTN